MGNNQQKSKNKLTEAQESARNSKRAEQRAQAELKRKKKQKIQIASVGGAAAVLLIGGGILWYNTGSRALRRKVIAKTENYEVTAAMFACYFRQCADSYLRYAEQDSSMTVFDKNVSLKEQEYSNGVTWYDMFLDNTMSTIKLNLQYAEAALADGYTLSEEDEATVQDLAENADLSRYQKGVRRSDMEKATRLTILADSYQKAAKEKISVSDDEVQNYYNAHQDAYMTASTLAYSFPWSPEGIISGDYAEHDAAAEQAEKLGKCKTQQEFTDFVFHYLTEEKEVERSEAEQMAADLTITDTIKQFPDEVQKWINGGAKPGETFVWPREDQCYASVYMLRDTPAADDSKTVDLRVIYLSASTYGDIDKAIEAANLMQSDVKTADDPSEMFANLAKEYSSDGSTYSKGGLVTGYSATRTTYGDEIAAWAFDRERQHGDMTVIARTSAVLLAYYENPNEKTGWENQVRGDLYQKKVDEFSQNCTANEVTVFEKNYKYLEPSAHLNITETA